ARLYAIADNNSETIKSIVSLFVSRVPEQMEELRQLLKSKNWKDLQLACHKIKSSYAIVGADEIKNYLADIEESCHNQTADPEQIARIINTIESLNPKVINELEKVMKN